MRSCFPSPVCRQAKWFAVGLMVWLGAVVTGQAASACLSARFNDWKDVGCRNRYGGMPDLSLNSTGGNRSGCPPCAGMPRWWVSEPYMNVWAADEPLSYQTSSGHAMTFRWTYHQRYQLPNAPSYYQQGSWPNIIQPLYVGRDSPYYKDMRTLGMSHAAWSMNWLSDLLFWDLSSETNRGTAFAQTYEVYFYAPDGGVEYLSAPNQMRTSRGARLSALSALGRPTVGLPATNSQGIYWCAGSTNGFRLEYPDGSVDLYQMSFPMGAPFDSTARAMLSARIDPQGRTTLLGYEKASGNDGTPWVVTRPKFIVDPDGRTNTINYLANHRWRISRITDPYGRNCQIGYNYSNGFLNSITDAVSNVSTFACITNGWLTSQTTPYGTTSFSYQEQREANSSTNEFMARGVHVKEPEGAQQLFYYLHNGSGRMTNSPARPSVANHTFDDGLTGSNHIALFYRNSFHWDRRNYASLSANVTNNLGDPQLHQFNFSLAVDYLTDQDFKKAHLKHWLLGASDLFSISEQLSSERNPSPDAGGTVEAARTWFDYPGKPQGSPELEGSDSQPSCIAWSLPDGTTHYVEQDYTSAGYPYQVRENYTKPGGGLGVRTNFFDYSLVNGIDLTSASNSAGQAITLVYNSLHQPTNIINALGQATRITWDSISHNFTGLRGPGGWSVAVGYDTNGFASSWNWNPQGLGIAITEYQAGLPRVLQQSGTGMGELWYTNTWDGLNRLTRVDYPDGTSRTNYFKRLDLAGQRDRLGSWVWFDYDGLQHLKSVTDQRSNVTQLAWCGCGALESTTDALTNTTSFGYNNQGLLTSIQWLDNTSLSREYDKAQRLWRETYGTGRTLTYGYNNQGLVTGVTNAYGRVRATEFDELDRPKVVVDAAGVGYTNAYDALNRLTNRAWQDGFSDRLSWATNGLAAYTDRKGKTTSYSRDGAGRLLTETNANLEVTTFEHSALGAVKDLWDGRSNHTAWAYDECGRVRCKTDGLGHEILRLTYNPNGEITNRWTPQFGDTVFRYDAAGNVTNIVALAPQFSSLGYTYDALNRLQSMTDEVGGPGTTFAYTPTGKLQTEDGPWSGDTVTYGYSQGLRNTLSLTPELNHTYGYDNAWRLTSLASQAGTFGYEYQGVTPLVSRISLPNSSSIIHHYDPLSRLDYTALQNRWGQVLDGYGYTHDPAGLRTNIVRNLGSTTSTVTVDYDPVGQIIGWTAREPDQSVRLNEKLGWGYDKSGNLQTRTNNALTQTFGNDAANQISSITRSGTLTVSGATPVPASSVTVNGAPAIRYQDFTFAKTNHALTGNDVFTVVAANAYGASTTNLLSTTLPVTLSPKYDLNGNLTNDGTRTFVYDAQNQLVTNWQTQSWKAEHVYDGLGRRRITREYGWQAGTGAWVKTNETRFIYDGRLVIQERNSSNGSTVTYTRGIDLGGGFATAGGTGGLLARTDSNGSAFYHSDGAGNITALSEGMESIAARYLYSPFGRLTAKWGPLADVNMMQFSSMPVHASSGLSLYPFRVYDSGLLRWLSRDPIGEAGGINLYGFVVNNPINNVDPLGMSSLLNPQAAEIAAAIESGAFESQGMAAQLAREAATRAAVQRAFQETASAAGREAAIKAGLTAGALVIMLPNGDMYSPPLPMPAGGKGPPGRPPCTTHSAPPFGPGDNEGAARGREAHKWWQPPPGFEPNFRFNSGDIADAVNLRTHEILEMKTSAGEIAKGWRQIARYIKAAQEQFGGKWTGRVVDSSGQAW